MVAGGIGNNAARPRRLVEGKDRVHRPAKLEGAATLEILAFEEHFRTRHRVEGARRQHRRPVREV
jgi:hypothetical protein